ncbi:MAG: SUMF1/EgtB/PvdO family nonheme iron enzyme [bacterium]
MKIVILLMLGLVLGGVFLTRHLLTLPTTKLNSKDNAEMVLVPAGEFLMGTSDEEKMMLLKAKPSSLYSNIDFTNECPQRKVELDAYYIYKTEVTVSQYRKFCEATKRDMPEEPSWKWHDTHPIVNVQWNDAKAYAVWAGVTLPTEAQWEKAARGTDGRIYPWGNVWEPKKCINSSIINSNGETLPVGSFPAGVSPYGCLDMAGNVWEWCEDWYDSDYYKIAPLKNPTGPDTGNVCVMRGGWLNEGYYFNYGIIRNACRTGLAPNYYYYGGGFRCAIPVAWHNPNSELYSILTIMAFVGFIVCYTYMKSRRWLIDDKYVVCRRCLQKYLKSEFPTSIIRSEKNDSCQCNDCGER